MKKRSHESATGGRVGRAEFSRLIQALGERAYRFAYRLCSNSAEAQDLVQEAFLRAFEKRRFYDPSRPFDVWLYEILRNIYFDALRRCARGVVSMDSRLTGGSPHGSAVPEGLALSELLRGPDLEPLMGMIHKEAQSTVQVALARLPFHYRSAVALRDVEDLPYEEISRLLDCPIGTVRSRIHQGRALLREAFVALEGEPEEARP